MFGSKPTPQSFWKWFTSNDRMLFDFEKDQDRLFDKLALKLRRIDLNLTFEFGPKIENRREFVISAGGIKSAFPAVIELLRIAPTLEHWQITGFRPRRPPICIVELRGKSVDPTRVEFTLIDNGKDIGIYLFLPGYDQADATWTEIGYLLLDEALGEYDVETKLGPIGMLELDAPQKGKRYPLAELPQIFDTHFLTLRQRAGNPPQSQGSN
jgi:hypothetical protein